MEISLKDISEYLKKSELYRNLLENSEDENDKILINPKHNRKDINIQSFDDLCIYLDIYRYWNLDESIKDLFYDYVKNNEINEDCITYLKINFQELELIEEFQYINKKTLRACNFAVEKGNLYLLKYLHKNGYPWNNLTCKNAANNLNCLIYLHENRCPWDEYTTLNASLNGHYDCLRYAHENGCPWNESTCKYAAINGHYDCLCYAHENGCPWDEYVSRNASCYGHLDCLKYAYENGCPLNKTFSYEKLNNKLDNNHLLCLNYINNICISIKK